MAVCQFSGVAKGGLFLNFVAPDSASALWLRGVLFQKCQGARPRDPFSGSISL